jgi:nicotinate-nucleotide adenylyltransferase
VARIGILGGTFNPPHLGHLVCAQEAVIELGLERMVLMPVGVPPHKEALDDPGREHRFEMCRLAIAKDERLAVSRLELDREGRSYTVDTLRAIHESAPGDDLTFIVGGDMAHSLPTWREPEALLGLATLAVAERAGARRAEIEQRLADLEGGHRVRFFEMPRMDISSSDIRRRVREGRAIRYLVPDEVVQYIGTHRLYRATAPGTGSAAGAPGPVDAPARAPAGEAGS